MEVALSLHAVGLPIPLYGPAVQRRAPVRVRASARGAQMGLRALRGRLACQYCIPEMHAAPGVTVDPGGG